MQTSRTQDPLIRTRSAWIKPEVMYRINGDLLKAWRGQRGIGQTALAEQLRCSQPLVSGLFRGQLACNQYLLERLASLLVDDPSRWHELVVDEEQEEERSA